MGAAGEGAKGKIIHHSWYWGTWEWVHMNSQFKKKLTAIDRYNSLTEEVKGNDR